MNKIYFYGLYLWGLFINKNMLHFAKSDTTETGNNYFYKLKYISGKNINISWKFYQDWLKPILLGNIDLHYKIWPSEFQVRTVFIFYYNNKKKTNTYVSWGIKRVIHSNQEILAKMEYDKSMCTCKNRLIQIKAETVCEVILD